MSDSRYGASLEQVARSTMWNLVGLSFPAVVAIIAIPVLIANLGEARFGVLALISLLIGYMNVFDFGLGRAQTWLIADRLARDKESEIPAVFWTALTAVFLISFGVGVGCYFFAGWMSESVLRFESDIRDEATSAFQWMAWVVPTVLLTPPLIGTLEAYQDFKLINLIRIPMGSFYFLGPLLVVPFFPTLGAVVLALMVGRVVECLIYMVWCFRRYPHLRRPAFGLRFIPSLFRFGGWISVSNVIQPFMIHADRFFIGALRSVSMVTFYSTPAEVVIKLWILPRSLVTVLFPNFTAYFARDPRQGSALFVQASRLMLCLLFLVTLVFVVGGEAGMTLWLGAEFGERSGPVVQWLAIGIFLLGLGEVSNYLLQGVGDPRRAALIYLLQLPVYVGLVWFSVSYFGIKGAAVAWSLRALLNFVLLFMATRKYLHLNTTTLCCFLAAVGTALGVLVLFAEVDMGLYKWIIGAVVALASLPLFWFYLFEQGEREVCVGLLRKFAGALWRTKE